MLVLRVHADEDDAARGGAFVVARPCAGDGSAAASRGRRLVAGATVTSDWDDSGQLEWLEEQRCAFVAASARRPGRRRRGRRPGARLRPARRRDRLAAGDPAGRRPRRRRVLDERGGDVDARGAGKPRGHGRRPGGRRALAVLRAHGLAGHRDRAWPAIARTRARGGGRDHRRRLSRGGHRRAHRCRGRESRIRGSP